jgi:hypothetical protein
MEEAAAASEAATAGGNLTTSQEATRQISGLAKDRSNYTYTSVVEPMSLADQSQFHAQIASLAILFVCSLTANGGVFLIFYRKPSLLTISNRFVLNLTVSNLLMTVFVMPMAFVSTVTGRWILGPTLCQINGVLSTTLFITCILTLTLISLDRFHAVIRPLHYTSNITLKRAFYMIICVWTVSFGFALPPVFGWNRYVYQADKRICMAYGKGRTSADKCYIYLMTCIFFVIPFVIMILVYVAVFRAAQKSSARARHNSVIPDSNNDQASSNGVGGGGHVPLHRRRSSNISLLHLQALRRRSSAGSRSILSLVHRDDWKAARTSLIVMFTFIFCWLPYFIVITWETTAGDVLSIPGWIQTASIWIAFSSTALNPVVYVFRCKPIRQELKSLIFKSEGSLVSTPRRQDDDCSSEKRVKDTPSRRSSASPGAFRMTPCSSAPVFNYIARSGDGLTRSPSIVTFHGVTRYS